MNRRGFLSGILLACAAPAIVRADSLMRIVPTETAVFAPTLADYDVLIEAGPSYAAEVQLSLNEFARLVIEPAMKKLADSMEHDFLLAAQGVRIRVPTSYLRGGA